MITLLATLLISYSATLQWNANPSEENVAGYFVYQGASSRNYLEPIDVGNVTTFRIDNLELGVFYYFAVTAYSTEGLESDYSEELTWYSPIRLWLYGGSIKTFLAYSASQSYMLEKSYNLTDWQGILQITPEKNEVQIPIDMTEQYAFYRIMKLDPQPQMAMKQVLRSLTAEITPPKIKKESWWKYNPNKYLKPKQPKGAYK